MKVPKKLGVEEDIGSYAIAIGLERVPAVRRFLQERQSGLPH